MITNNIDEYGDKVVFKWELLEDEFKQVLIDSDRDIKDINKWWEDNKENILHYFKKGFDVLVEDYGVVINNAIDEVWNTDEEKK